MRDFSAKTLAALTARGVRVIGLQAIPGDGPMGLANATRGYRVDDQGTGRVWTHAQVLEAAQ